MKEEKNCELKDLETRLSWIVGWVKVCDTKTSFLLALVGVMLPLTLQSKLLQEDMMSAFKLINNNCCWKDIIVPSLFVIFVMAFGTLLLMSCWKFLNVLFAKRTESLSERILRRNKDAVDDSVLKDSLLHFHHISTLKYEQFKADIDAEKSSRLREDLLSQIYINSCRCDEKYSYFNDGLRYLFFSGVLLLLAYLFHMILFGR